MGIPDIDQCNIVAKGGRMVVRHEIGRAHV